MGLPSGPGYLFALPLFAQVVLLHPVFQDGTSHVLRLLLAPATVYLSLVTLARHPFTPIKDCTGVNMVLGVLGAYAALKGIEFGLVRDRSAYTWLGFEEDYAAKKDEDAPSFGSSKHIQRVRKQHAEQDSVKTILASSFHLLLSMRGIGYGYSPPKRALAKPLSKDPATFLAQAVMRLVVAHCIFVACALVLTSSPFDIMRQLHRAGISFRRFESYTQYLQFIPSKYENMDYRAASSLVGLALGLGAFSGLSLGYALATVLVFLWNKLCRLVLPTAIKPAPFDRREFTPVFQEPWKLSDVSGFWSRQWHSFFLRPFVVLGYNPGNKIGTMLGGKQSGRALGVMATFAVSGWLHQHAIEVSTEWMHGGRKAFLIKYGGTLYFLLQGCGIVLEGAFKSMTGKRVGGPLGSIWTGLVVAGSGVLLYQSWIGMGLTNRIPKPSEWTWHRYVVPLACLMPRTVWSKHA